MEINDVLNFRTSMIQENIGISLLKKTIDFEKQSSEEIIKMLPDFIGKNIDLIV